MKSFYSIPTLCLLCGIYSFNVWSEPLKVSQDLWAPYVMKSAVGNGIAHDLVMGGLKASGYEVRFKVKPWARVLKETLNGKNDVIIAIWKTKQRASDYLFTDAYMYNQMAVVSHQDKAFDFISIESLNGQRVALIDNYAYGADLLDYEGYIHVPSIHLPNSIRLLLSDRADILVTDENVGHWTLREMRLNNPKLTFHSRYLESTPLYAAVRRDHPQAQQIVASLNHYFATQGSHKLTALKTKYGLEEGD